MSTPFVPPDFMAPTEFHGPGFSLEPLGPQHNERDHRAWMSSIEHIRNTPGYPDGSWPRPMSLEENRADLIRHADDFVNRTGFTYSILDGDEVIGCLYIYPPVTEGTDAEVLSWVTKERSDMDTPVWRAISEWLESAWPFEKPDYPPRP